MAQTDKATSMPVELQGCRESAVNVCRSKGERLRRRGDAYILLAHVINLAKLTEAEEGELWSLVTFND